MTGWTWTPLWSGAWSTSVNEIREWAKSGAMALTGRRDGPPLVAPGDPASTVRRALDRIARASERRTGESPRLPGVGLLSERAAAAGFTRQGPWSCGGSFRTVPTSDGWFGLSLARPSDLELLPALTESDGGADPWEVVARWSAGVRSEDAADRAGLLGMAACAAPVAADPVPRPGVVCTDGASRCPVEAPRVLDLTSLWAGPLCAHLLSLGGARITKVESIRRPDGARSGPRSFFELLHHGHESVVLDFDTSAGRRRLRTLIEQSDLVLEASRPRALRQLGILAEDHVAAGISWVSISARGRTQNRVGFGDDVAVGAGLHIVHGDEVLPCADALADPLTGVVAAACAAEALLLPVAKLIDVSMHDVAREAALRPTEPHVTKRIGGRWWVETASGHHPVVRPSVRRASW